jgi:hypothetical protein
VEETRVPVASHWQTLSHYVTVYIHNDSFPIKSAFLPPFRIRKRFLSELCSDNMHFKLIDMKTKGMQDFSEQLNIKVIYVRHTHLTVYSVKDFVQKIGQLTFSSYFELLWWLKCSVNCSEKSCIPFVFISISLKCMLSEHSSERKRFLIRKGGKNADLIGKESLWIYTVT